MNQPRPTGSPAPGPLPDADTGHVDSEHRDLARRVTAALRAHEPDDAHTAATAQRIAAGIAAAEGRTTVVTPFARRAGLIAVTGVVTSTIAMAGAGAAAAANPYSGFAAAVDGVVQAVGVEWSSMPDGYTREQYEAFWGADYTSKDLASLNDLWHTESLETKARAGQMILDGDTVPVAPGSFGPDQEVDGGVSPEALAAYREAGYTLEDAEQLAELWQVEPAEAKARAADLLLAGKPVPLP